MTNDTRTSDDIERDIADERAQMSDSINDLQRKFSVDAIMSDLGGMIRGQGGDLGRAFSDTVGRNPAAVVLVGVGLAWLLLGQDRTTAKENGRNKRQSASRHDRNASHDLWDRARSSDGPEDGPFHGDEDYWYGNGQMSGDRRTADGRSSKRSEAGDVATGMADTLRAAASSVGDAVSDAAGSVRDAASGLTDRLSHGLDDLSEEARTRIFAARKAAQEARQSSQEMMRKGSRAASGLFEDQPLVIGALAVALGAAIGGALPHSKLEDDAMGNGSDQLFADAQAVYREERDKAMAALRMAAQDTKGEIREMGEDLADLVPQGKSVGDVIVDRTADAASRVIHRATGDIDHQDRDTQRT